MGRDNQQRRTFRHSQPWGLFTDLTKKGPELGPRKLSQEGEGECPPKGPMQVNAVVRGANERAQQQKRKTTCRSEMDGYRAGFV